MITLERINELERVSNYFLQKLAYAKLARTALTAIQGVKVFHTPAEVATAETDLGRHERNMLAAADELHEELTKLLPDCAAAQTGGKE